MPRTRAFTLIESIMALVLLTLAVPPIVVAIRGAESRRIAPVLASQARWLATEKLEDIVADRSSASRGYSWVAAGNYPAESSVAGFPGFGRSVGISETGPDLSSSGTGYKKVTVSVTWTDPMKGTARSLAIATVLTDYTP